jgi:hypothetical protein
MVRPVHPKAMPAILIETVEQAEWIGGEAESLRLQPPIVNERLVVSNDRVECWTGSAGSKRIF